MASLGEIRTEHFYCLTRETFLKEPGSVTGRAGTAVRYTARAADPEFSRKLRPSETYVCALTKNI